MTISRRTLLIATGVLPMLGFGERVQAAASTVKPRHVLCLLGGEGELPRLQDAASRAIEQFAAGFSVDTTYSQGKADPNMSRSFGVCWDRVAPNAWTDADETAVADHKSVLYVLGPPMSADNAVMCSAGGLFLVDAVIKAGATAAKGESAGVAHGLARWGALAHEAAAALQSDDNIALRRACRLAFAKRPLAGATHLETVGFHLVGLPEVYVAKAYGSEREVVALMDEAGDRLAQCGLEAVLADRKAQLSYETSYEPDDFKFNPYGIVTIDLR
ncbi:hypothetical protein H8A95_39745 [Bradyrhizobium sp. Pear76]|nr:hypothetical protein [Bradyrhizobium oropedii]